VWCGRGRDLWCNVTSVCELKLSAQWLPPAVVRDSASFAKRGAAEWNSSVFPADATPINSFTRCALQFLGRGQLRIAFQRNVYDAVRRGDGT